MNIRKKFVLATAALSIALLGPSANAKSIVPIRIGVPIDISGPFSTIEGKIKRAVEFAVGQANAKGGIDGRRVEVRYADTEGNPDTSRKQVEKLALQGYNLLFGTNTSSEGLADAPMLTRLDALLVSSFSKTSKLIGASCQPRFFRANQSDPTEIKGAKAWLQTRPEKKWVTIANDYSFGHDATDGFNAAAKALGKNVVLNVYPPLGTNDYAPYIQQLKSVAPDGVMAIMSGRDAITFLTQAKHFGLLGSTLMAGITLTQSDIVTAVGLDTVGIWGNVDYSSTIDTPENKAFVTAWKGEYHGADPTDVEGQAYTGISVLLQAIEKSGSDSPAAVAKALSGGTFITPYGHSTMRAQDHQLLIPVYFGQVKSVNGKPVNVVAFTLSADKAAPAFNPACKL